MNAIMDSCTSNEGKKRGKNCIITSLWLVPKLCYSERAIIHNYMIITYAKIRKFIFKKILQDMSTFCTLRLKKVISKRARTKK